MDLSKESFPNDLDFIIEQTEEVSANNSLSIIERSFSGLSSREKSSEDNSHEEQSNAKRIFKQKAHSYQDLHSEYTKKRYHHVKSKVKEYIASIKAKDRTKNIQIVRHRSLPETIGIFTDYDPEPITDEPDPNEIHQLLHDKEQEIVQLRTMNEYLESNLQEKLATLARLRMNADRVRIELLEIKEKQRRQSIPSDYLRYSGSHRYSLPINSFSEQATIRTHTIGTQTENKDLSNDNSNEFDIVDLNEFNGKNYLEFIGGDEQCNDLRLRSYSNSIRYENIDLNYSNLSTDLGNCQIAEKDELKSEIGNQKELICETNQQDSFVEVRKNRKGQKKKLWKHVMNPCKRVVLCCNHVADGNDYFYQQISAEDVPLTSLDNRN